MESIPTPNFNVAKKSLHFFFLADCSGSMSGDKIQSLNQAIRNAIPEMRSAASQNPQADVFVRAVKFETNATWHIKDPVPLESFSWVDLTVGGSTAMGGAIRLVTDVLHTDKLGKRNFPPVLVLVTDGYATDNFTGALADLLANPWGKRAIKIAIGIGHDYDQNKLERFIDNSEIPVLQANNPEKLTTYIKWASTEVLKTSSGVTSDAGKNTPAPVLPADDDSDDDVF